MARTKGALNKKTIEKLRQQGVLGDIVNETPVNTSNLTDEIKETNVNILNLQDFLHEKPVNTDGLETQSNETQVNTEVSGDDYNQSTVNNSFSQEKNDEIQANTEVSDEQSLLDDFLKFKEKKENNEQFTENEEFNDDFDDDFNSISKNKEYLPVEKQLIILDGIIIFILNTFFKQKIEKMSSEDVYFIASLAGSEEINLLPSGKNMFYMGLAAYYFSKINFKNIFK